MSRAAPGARAPVPRARRGGRARASPVAGLGFRVRHRCGRRRLAPLRREVEQDAHDLRSRYAVDGGMVDLGQQRHVSVLEPVDQVQLPQGRAPDRGAARRSARPARPAWRRWAAAAAPAHGRGIRGRNRDHRSSTDSRARAAPASGASETGAAAAAARQSCSGRRRAPARPLGRVLGSSIASPETLPGLARRFQRQELRIEPGQLPQVSTLRTSLNRCRRPHRARCNTLRTMDFGLQDTHPARPSGRLPAGRLRPPIDLDPRDHVLIGDVGDGCRRAGAASHGARSGSSRPRGQRQAARRLLDGRVRQRDPRPRGRAGNRAGDHRRRTRSAAAWRWSSPTSSPNAASGSRWYRAAAWRRTCTEFCGRRRFPARSS